MKLQKGPLYAVMLLTLPTLVVALAVVISMKWRVPTRVRLDLTATRALLTIGGTDWTQVVNALDFRSLTVERFDTVTLSPDALRVADPSKYLVAEDRYPDSAWKDLGISPPLVIKTGDKRLNPAVTFESPESGGKKAGTLDRIWARPGSEFVFEARGGRPDALTMQIENHESSAALTIHRPVRLIVDYGSIQGVEEMPYRADSLRFRARFPDHRRDVGIVGSPHSLVLVLSFLEKEDPGLVSMGGIPVAAVAFTRQNPAGYPETSLVKEGTLVYADYPERVRVEIRASDYIKLNKLDRFRITNIIPDAEHKGLRFVMEGMAGRVLSGPHGFAADRRLTVFDTLWNDPRLMVLFSIIMWVFPTTVGAYRLYKEVKG